MPKDNSDFVKIENLKQLTGTYINKGDPKGLLSHAIFTYNKSKIINHDNIELINVSVSGNIFTIKAIENDCAVYEEKFTYGSDFKINNNVIVIKNNMSVMTKEVLGPNYDRFVIGIDEKGHGKSKSSGGVVGLYGLFIPVAVYESHETRFIRTNINKNYNKCVAR